MDFLPLDSKIVQDISCDGFLFLEYGHEEVFGSDPVLTQVFGQSRRSFNRLARGENGCMPSMTAGLSGDATIFSIACRTPLQSTCRFRNTLAAKPSPSCRMARSMCWVPMNSEFSR